ncbi:TetR/AcrR family transcriptional regulator [Spirillospora sp. NPDC029432]|uniref:TetR/AcrR family transcriptional regulator n=1 Tax=Spirillospora sp. NPDC029432 TaxID=3154599 RepID=UPI00345440CD
MPTAERRTTGRPPRISRAEIVGTARRIVAEQGVGKLTMRGLAREIGSTPMALYHHVRDKEELLLLLLDDIAASAPRPDPLPADPRERLVTVATAMHDLLAGCPWIVEVLTADDLMAEAALWYSEHIVDAAVAAGLGLEEAVDAYRTVWYYTAGQIITTATSARRRAQDERPTYRDRVFAGIDPAAYPRLASVGARWTELTARDTYAEGLRALVRGLLPEG